MEGEECTLSFQEVMILAYNLDKLRKSIEGRIFLGAHKFTFECPGVFEDNLIRKLLEMIKIENIAN